MSEEEKLIDYLNSIDITRIFYDNPPHDNHVGIGGAIQELLDLYNKEKETSHFIQSQLDEANAKLIGEKEKNKELFEEYNKRVSTIIKYEQTIKTAIDEFTDVLED